MKKSKGHGTGQGKDFLCGGIRAKAHCARHGLQHTRLQEPHVSSGENGGRDGGGDADDVTEAIAPAAIVSSSVSSLRNAPRALRLGA